MKLEDQVISVELAKRLEQLLGEEIKSSFYWIPEGVVHWHLAQQCNKGFVIIVDDEVYTESCMECYAAYTVAELGQMLPAESGMKFFESHYNDHLGEWGCQFRGFKTVEAHNEWDWGKIPPLIHETEGDTEAEARADMLIYLLENKLVSVEEINNRIKE